MAAFEQLLHRLGFVKLGRFGLELTPEGRILSTRSAVLDDGAGGRIVGWEDSDLAAVELAPWHPDNEQAARRPVVRRFPVPPAPPPARMRSPALPPAVPAASLPAAAPAVVAVSVPVAAAAPPAVVADEPVVDEDDWEWTIALARARTEGATEPVRRVSPTPTPTRPMPSLAPKEPATSGEWPATAPVGAIDYADYSHMPTRPAMPIPKVAEPRQASVMAAMPTPSTVIPVPRLPSMETTAQASRLEPVVRTIPAQTPRRLAKGTADIGPAPHVAISDVTRLGVVPASPRTQPMAIQDGDRTRPGIALPPAARTVALPTATPRSRSPR